MLQYEHTLHRMAAIVDIIAHSVQSPPPRGWVNVFGRINHLSISPSQPGQLSRLYSVGRKMSTSQSEVTFYGAGSEGRLIPLRMNAYLSAYREPAHNKWSINKAYSSCMVMSICDTSLQNMSLTQNVLNDNCLKDAVYIPLR